MVSKDFPEQITIHVTGEMKRQIELLAESNSTSLSVYCRENMVAPHVLEKLSLYQVLGEVFKNSKNSEKSLRSDAEESN